MPYFRIPFSYRIAAVSAAATLPVPTGDMSLSPAGPDVVPPAAPATPGATPRLRHLHVPALLVPDRRGSAEAGRDL